MTGRLGPRPPAQARPPVPAEPRPPVSAEDPLASVTVAYRVRFDECSPAGLVRAGAHLRYAQDVAWIHSERLGYDRAWYAERGIAWVARGIQLAILEPSASADELLVTTRLSGYRRVYARRRTDIRATDGRLVAWAFTDWVMTDARGMPTRVPDEFPRRFPVPSGTFEPTKVPRPPADALARAVELHFGVRPHELDPLGHANNAVYVDWVDEAAEAVMPRRVDIVPRHYAMEYLLPVAPGTRLVAFAWDDGEALGYHLRDEAGRDLFRARLARSVPDPLDA